MTECAEEATEEVGPSGTGEQVKSDLLVFTHEVSFK